LAEMNFEWKFEEEGKRVVGKRLGTFPTTLCSPSRTFLQPSCAAYLVQKLRITISARRREQT
jgi:hypothetical protein